MALVTCAKCGTVIDPAGQPSSCPECGSGDRLIGATDALVAELKEKAKSDKKRRGKKKAYEEVTIGDDLHRDSGQWNRIEQVIDRDNDRYRKRITDAEGTILRDDDKPLSLHRGHGSAKYAKQKPVAAEESPS